MIQLDNSRCRKAYRVGVILNPLEIMKKKLEPLKLKKLTPLSPNELNALRGGEDDKWTYFSISTQDPQSGVIITDTSKTDDSIHTYSV
ncbi:MAG: hypothetical protein ACLSG8_08430 [Barnesiella sp.]